MSNKSKFIDMQTDPCDLVEPEEKPLDRVCPTCIPNPSFLEPQWWKEETPWLNEKTCEYSVAVFVNQEGESYRLSDLKDILEPKEVVISESGIPESPKTTATVSNELGTPEEQEIKNKEKFDRLKRSFVKPGIRSLLRHYEKLENDEIVCAREDCSVFTTSEARMFITQRKLHASMNSDVSFYEWARKEQQDIEKLPEIDNPNALELYAQASDYYFYGMANGIMAVLITIPAHIFDQVPGIPTPSDVDTSTESVRFKLPEFHTWIAKLEASFVLFSKFQSYFNKTEEGRLFQLDDGKEVPFYTKFMTGRFEKFETNLAKFLESKGYDYYSSWAFLDNSNSSILEVELKFDKSDEKKPFKLADTIIIKPANCDDVTLKLPEEPDPLLPTGDNIRHTAFFDQTLMGYIAKYKEIKTELDANKNPPWLDFLAKHTYPTLGVNYGNSMDSKFNAIGCLLDKFQPLDDAILNSTMTFFDALQYQFSKNTCRLLKDKDKGKITVFNSDEELKKLERAQKERENRQLKEMGLMEKKAVKSTRTSQDVDDSKLAELLNTVNPCNYKKLVMKGIQCLMSGMTFETGIQQILKGLLGTVTSEGMEIILSGLPADTQAAVREKVEKEFEGLPAPWEVGYEPGDVEAAYDRQSLENIKQSEGTHETYEELFAMWTAKSESLEKSRNEGPDYATYIEAIEQRANKLSSNISLHEEKVMRIENSKLLTEAKLPLLKELVTRYENELRDAVTTATDADAIRAARTRLDVAKDNYSAETDQLEKVKDDLKQAKEQLEEFKNVVIEVKPEEQYKQEFNELIKQSEQELKELEQKMLEAGEKSREQIKENPDYIGFSDKTEEEQAKIIEQEKEKHWYVQHKKEDQFKQGTYGRAVGNVQKELMGAYADAILQNGSVQDIMKGLDKLPGSTIVSEFFAAFDCPNHSFFYPPIDEFMGTFTLGACGKGKTRPFSLPALSALPDTFDMWKNIKDTFLYAFKKTMSQVVSALMLKSISAGLDTSCKGLTGLGQIAKDNLEAAKNGGRFPRSFSEILADVVCGDALTEEEKDKAIDNLFDLTGSPQRGATTPQDILDTMSTLGSESDYLNAMIGRGDPDFLANVSRTLSILHPDYSNLATPQGLDQMLQNAGNYLTDEQKQRAAELAADPQQFFPLDPSICLTNEQAEQYYEDLKNVYATQIGDPDIAQQFVDNQRNRAKSDLSDLAKALAEGPNFQDGINELFADPDPDCAVNKSLLQTPEEIKKDIEALSKGMFARLQKAFIDDTIEENVLEFWDTKGILLVLTSDKVGYNYAKHMNVRNNLFFRILAWAGFYDNEAPFPDTVGNQMRTRLFENVDAGKENYKYTDESKILLEYDNGIIEKEGRYTSKITLMETIKTVTNNVKYHSPNFNYQFQGISSDTTNNFIVENIITPDKDKYINNFIPTDEEIALEKPEMPVGGTNTFRNLVFKNFLESSVSKIGQFEFSKDETFKILSEVNNFMFRDFMPTLLNKEDSDSPSNGFVHGGGEQELITLEDLTYVDPAPGATEYTHEEEDGILGKSMTDNPRVKFLDPLRHGGSYTLPNIYIEPDMPSGWLSFTKLIVPNIDGCGPRGTNFLSLEQLEKELQEKEDKITPSDKLSESPECLTEVPFEKIASSATLAALEQVIIATIRVHVTQFLINSFNIHGNLALNDKNYDELIYEYISSKMQQSLSSEYSMFASTYEGYTYWLLFLEQCAQTYNRMVQLGQVTVDKEAQSAMDQINTAQIAYVKPKRDTGALFDNDFKVELRDPKTRPRNITQFLSAAREAFDDVYAYPAVGGYLIAQNTRRWADTFKPSMFERDRSFKGGSVTLQTIMNGGSFRFWTQSQMNFAAKIATIAENENAAIVFLKRLISMEMKRYSDKLAVELNPRPLVYDINKFFIGGSRVLLGDKIRAGIYDVEVPIGGASGVDLGVQSSTEAYGTINHCAKSDGTSAFDLMNLNDFQIEKVGRLGGLYLEKYLRIVPKANKSETTGLTPGMTPAEMRETAKFLIPDNLPSGIQNVKEFIQFLNTVEIPEEANVSDWFGNAKVDSKDENKYKGSIGIKFGVRVVLATPKSFKTSLSITNIDDIVTKSREQKTFLLNKDNDIVFIPLASYEQDILDKKLSSFKEANEDFNQDIKCFIDGLTQSNKFDLIFNRVFNIKKVGSTLACYSDMNLVASLGQDINERQEPDVSALAGLFGADEASFPTEDDRTDFFNDCRSECRKLFVSNYKRNDFDPPSEEEEIDELSLATERALAKTYAATAFTEEVSWLVRRRVKPGKPTDKEGKPCKNQFGSLFNIKR